MSVDAELCLMDTCYLSRIKLGIKSNLLDKVKLVTFHSLYLRIFQSAIAEDPTSIKYFVLNGNEMYGDIEKAVKSVIPKASPTDIYKWYQAIRLHLNEGTNIATLENGKGVLAKYLDVKNAGLSFEESAQIATYLLENKQVKEIKDFRFDYIIIPDFELIEMEKNFNTYKFLQAFCKWNDVYGNKNIYRILGNDIVIPYQILIKESDTFTELFLFNTKPEELEQHRIINLNENTTE